MPYKRKADCTPEEWARRCAISTAATKRWREKHPERARESQLKQRSKPGNRKKAVQRQRDYYHRPEIKARYKALGRHKRVSDADPSLIETLHVLQKGRCAICERELNGQENADHCHNTNVMRGLLCRNCNTAEGHIAKTGLSPIEFAQRLEAYLANPPAEIAKLA